MKLANDDVKKAIVYQTALANLLADFEFYVAVYEKLGFMAEKMSVETFLKICKNDIEAIGIVLNESLLDENFEKVMSWKGDLE